MTMDSDQAPAGRSLSVGGADSPWHTLATEEAGARLDVRLDSGLGEAEVAARLARYGPNRLREERREPIWEVFLEEVREPMILLLLITGVLYAVWGEVADTVTIFFVILTLVSVEVVNEHRAEGAIAALRQLAEPATRVRRAGRPLAIATEAVVPGDVVLLDGGERVPADARLVEAYGLAVDESALTGESLPVEKTADLALPADTPLAERRNLVFAGTTVTRGRGTAIAVATGMATELGRIAGLSREVKPPRTPLQQSMRELTRWLIWLALGFSVLVPLLGWLGGQPFQQMLLTGLSLAFATIPEEMPIIITMVLALGAYRLSRRRAIVKDLRAVETLGAITVIATDKTGTLTENCMAVRRCSPGELDRQIMTIGALCNDAVEDGDGFAGDPLETALLRTAREAGMDPAALRRAYPLRDEFTFDNVRKLMSIVRRHDGALWIGVKGAPEAVLARSTRQLTRAGAGTLADEDRQAILAAVAGMAAEGLRVIAFAQKTGPDSQPTQDDAESDLTFVGLAGLADPPRPEAQAAITACRAAGIRPLMITGDHPLTARTIAAQVGLDGEAGVLTGPELDALSDEALGEAVGRVAIYARTTPEHKLRIVEALHRRAERVAVTGDGINDAPALAAADIGVAMGETGTDVARQAADVVLADDNFATIVRAVEEGRVLFANLKKGVRYYLACKVALISATLLPALLGVPVPFAPIQIILMELFMDLAASSTFVVEPPDAGLMRRPPRDPGAPFMDRSMAGSIVGAGMGLFAAVSAAYLITWYSGAGTAAAQTIAFVTWLLGHVFLAMNLRSEREPLVRLGLFSNRLMVGWAAATIAFVLLVTLLPAARVAFKTLPLSGGAWALAIGAALAGTFWMEAYKWLLFRAGGWGGDLKPLLEIRD